MKKVWIASDSIVSPLGATTFDNYEHLRQGISAIRLIDDPMISTQKFFGARIEDEVYHPTLTKFEAICSRAIHQALDALPNYPDPKRSVLILSSTKGNISLLDDGRRDDPRIHLHATASFLAERFGFSKHLVVSNACISGVMAIVVGKRMIEADQVDHAVIVGADTLSRFVVSGFQSLQALSPEICKPFDVARKGINLGECAAAIVLTSDPESLGVQQSIRISGGGFSNDANHISGPSRTGDELGYAIQQAMDEAKIALTDIDFISAHGTATLYNDEMEANAFSTMGMENIPLNSLKGYFGHTLGAAGVAEVAISAKSLMHNELIPSKGFERSGVTKNISVIQSVENRPLKTCLKTASGFGGCNAAIILQK